MIRMAISKEVALELDYPGHMPPALAEEKYNSKHNLLTLSHQL